MIRLLDFIFSLFDLIFLFPLGIIVYIIGFFATGCPLYKQERVGENKKPFILYKYRKIHVKTASVATHMANKSSVTKFGSFLKKKLKK